MEDISKSSHTTAKESDGVFKEGELLQKVFDMVMREKLVLGMDESEKMVEFKHPEELKGILDLAISGAGMTREDAEGFLETTMRYSVKTQHPCFFKQFYHGVDELGLSAAWLMEALNINQFFYESAPVFVLMELFVVEKMVKIYGWENGDGIFCPGGSISNMTAVLLARHHRDPTIKRTGLSGRKPPVLFTSDQSHYSLHKTGFCMGIGLDNVVEVRTDADGKMIPEALREAVKEARAKGCDPFFVNATCGTTILGSCDPLDELADICKEEGLWLHADGCVGGAAIFSKTNKGFLAGIHRADSIAWNAHKMLCVPLQCSLLLTRYKNLLYESNSIQASYLSLDDKYYDQSYDLWDKSFQCSRKVDVMKLYLTLSFHGLGEVERRVDGAFGAARYLDQQVAKRPGFRQVIPRVQSTNTCFWFIPPSLRGRPETVEWWQKLGKVAPQVSERMVKGGKLMVTYQPNEAKNFVNFFRMTTHTHPTPTHAHMDYLLDEIERLGSDL